MVIIVLGTNSVKHVFRTALTLPYIFCANVIMRQFMAGASGMWRTLIGYFDVTLPINTLFGMR